MNREDANKLAKEVFNEWIEEKNNLVKKAKSEGLWLEVGLDSNNHLFSEVNKKAIENLNRIKKMVDEG